MGFESGIGDKSHRPRAPLNFQVLRLGKHWLRGDFVTDSTEQVSSVLFGAVINPEIHVIRVVCDDGPEKVRRAQWTVDESEQRIASLLFRIDRRVLLINRHIDQKAGLPASLGKISFLHKVYASRSKRLSGVA